MKKAIVTISIIVLGLSVPLWFGYSFLPTDLLKWTAPWNESTDFVDAQNHFYLDPIGEHYPWKVLLKNMIHERQLPLWNPFNLYGVPYLASSTPQVFDVTNVLYAFLSSRLAFDVSILLKVWLSALAMLLLLRHYNLSKWGATLGAISYMLNGAYIGSYHAGWMLGAWMWVPLVVLFLEQALRERRIIHGMIAGIFLGLAHLGGNVQISLQIFLLLGLWSFAHLLVRKSDAPSQRKRWLAIGIVAGASILSLAIAAVQLIPTYELLSNGLSRDYSLMAWLQDLPRMLLRIPLLISFLIPNFIGHHSIFSPVLLTGAKWSDFVQGYAGFIPLLLAGVAVLFRKETNIRIWRFVAFGTLFVLFLTPFVIILYFRALVVWCFAIAVLSGYGLDYLTSHTNEIKKVLHRLQRWLTASVAALLLGLIAVSTFLALKGNDFLPAARAYVGSKIKGTNPTFSFNAEFYLRKVAHTFDYYRMTNIELWIPLFIMSLLALCLAFYRKQKLAPGHFRIAVFALTATDMALFAASYVPIVSLDKYPAYPPTPAIEFLQADRSLFRIMPAQHEGADPPIFHFESNILFGFSSTSGCGSLNYMRTMRFIETFEDADPGPNPIKYPQVVALTNAKYVLTKSLSLPETHYRRVYRGELNIYETRDVLPRAYLVDRFRVMPGDSVLQIIKRNEFDYKQEVLLEDQPELPIEAPDDFDDAPGAVKIARYTPNRVSLKAKASGNGLLVLSDVNYPGWRATVDGDETKILRANYLFRAVAVPAGEHVIEFSYFPASFRAGLIVSALTLLACLGVFLLANRSKSETIGAQPEPVHREMHAYAKTAPGSTGCFELEKEASHDADRA